MTKKQYLKKYRQKPEVKQANAARMKAVLGTPEGKEYNDKKNRYVRGRWLRGRANAKRRKKVFTLPYEEYLELIAQPCYACGTDISQETGIGLDRADNDRGYESGNCRPCCSNCNRRRNRSMDADEFARQSELNNYRKK